MRLISLTCDQPSFQSIAFKSEGLTLILGDAAEGEPEDGSSNGVGKTLAVGLVHHCLGANVDARLRKAVPAWIFTLAFELQGKTHIIQRSGDGKKLIFDDQLVSLARYKDWLDSSGAFVIDPSIPGLSFRSLVKRFARYSREDCVDPIHTAREQDYDGRLRSLYLLGIDVRLALTKKKHKNELDELAKSLKNWQEDYHLKDVFRAGAQPKVRAEWLEREIARLKADLAKFQVAEDYRAVELEAGDLTHQLRAIEQRMAVLQFQREGIEKAIQVRPDISKTDLLDLYEGLQSIFKPSALAHFDAVEAFHQALAANRRARLEADRSRIVAEAGELESRRQLVATQRDEKLQSLQGKRALDEYATIARHVAGLEAEQAKLAEFINFESSLKERAQRIREQKVEEDRIAGEYVASEPIAPFDRYFSALATLLYPQLPSGIVLTHNTGDNQVRYDLAVQIEGDDSDGINAARIICFDWTIFMRGANHSMHFLWHDNRLFADLDPNVRALWMSHVIASLSGTGRQYIATMNTENFDTMAPHLASAINETLHSSVVLTLRGDAPEHKLLGIQFGK